MNSKLNYLTHCIQNVFANGHWSTPADAPIGAIDPKTKGLQIKSFSLPPDSAVSIPFTVNDTLSSNFGWFEFSNELVKGAAGERWSAVVSSEKNGGGEVYGTFSGRDTGTDEPHARYRRAGTSHPQKGVMELDPRQYFYTFWNEDGSACVAPLGHQNNY